MLDHIGLGENLNAENFDEHLVRGCDFSINTKWLFMLTVHRAFN